MIKLLLYVIIQIFLMLAVMNCSDNAQAACKAENLSETIYWTGLFVSFNIPFLFLCFAVIMTDFNKD